jgi:hypothetical protein
VAEAAPINSNMLAAANPLNTSDRTMSAMMVIAVFNVWKPLPPVSSRPTRFFLADQLLPARIVPWGQVFPGLLAVWTK